ARPRVRRAAGQRRGLPHRGPLLAGDRRDRRRHRAGAVRGGHRVAARGGRGGEGIVNTHSIALSALLALAGVATPAQEMFRGDAAHHGVAAAAAPRAFHRVKWIFPTGARVVSSAVWRDGMVLFGSDDGNVYAVDAATGRQRWMTHTGGPVASTPAVSGGRVFAVSGDGRLYALDARSGE